MEIKLISNENRRQINQFIISHWFSTDMVIRGKVFDMTILDGYAAYENEKIIGLITYRIEDNECEIMSLDSLIEKQGIGSTLLSKPLKEQRKINAKKSN